MIKALFFDIDGTLLDHSPQGGGKMPASTLACLEAAHRKGIQVFVATGRIPSMATFLKDLFPFDGAITLNGQLALGRDGELLHRMAHHPEDILQLVEIVQKDPFPCLIIEEEESFYVTDDPVIQKHFAWAGLDAPKQYRTERLQNHPVLQFLAYIPMEEAQQRLASLEHIEITTAGGDILDVIPKEGGKEVGIAAVAKQYGWQREEIMVFGDGGNDVRMLRWAGIGVAMGNGAPAAKAAADYITTPVGEDGVKNALLHFGVLTEQDLASR